MNNNITGYIRANKKRIRKLLITFACLAVVNILVFSNLTTVVGNGYQEKQVMDTYYVGPEGGSVEIDDIECKTKTISLELETDSEAILEADIYTKDEGHAFYYSRDQKILFNAHFNSVDKSLISQGKLHSIQIYIPQSESGVYIQKIIFNKPVSFSFRLSTYVVMCLLALLLWIISGCGLMTCKMDLSEKKQKIFLTGGVMLAVVMAMFLCVISQRKDDTLLYHYEKGNIEDMPVQQMVLFDALHHGTVRLGYEVDPDYQLFDNIYDNTERSERGYDAPWDVAFYNGSYYSYFGSLPIIVFYEIFYILTGFLPGVNLQMFLFMVVGILGLYAATYQMLKYFELQPSLFNYVIANWGILAGSFFFIIASSTEVYTLSIILGIGSLLWGIAFAYQAVMCQKKKKRVLCYIMCGLALVCTVALRPPVLLMLLAFIMPPFVRILFNKDMTFRQKAYDVIPFCIPVILGAFILMAYNYIRFDSVLEFGARYQLTVSDVRYNKMTWSLNNILAAFYYYGFRGVDIKAKFPFLFYNSNWDYVFGKCLYQECTLGVFAFPMNLFAIGIWSFSSKNSKKELSIMTKLVFLVSMFLILFDFGMGGLVSRYAGDFAIGFSICAFFVLVYKETIGLWDNVEMRRLVYAVIAVTLIMGGLLLFSNDPIKYQIFNENPNIYMYFANLFDI